MRSGQTHVRRSSAQLLDMILNEELHTTFVISHRLPLEKAREGYGMCKEQQQNALTKVVLKPGATPQ